MLDASPEHRQQVGILAAGRGARLGHPDELYVCHKADDDTNTSKSLLRSTGPGGVLWMNGDVVFDEAVLARTLVDVTAEQSFIAVNTDSVAEEEVMYTVDGAGWIDQLSKTVVGRLGDAVGVNHVAAGNKAALLAIDQDGLRFRPLDISELGRNRTS